MIAVVIMDTSLENLNLYCQDTRAMPRSKHPLASSKTPPPQPIPLILSTPQDTCGIAAVVTGQGDELIQKSAFVLLPRPSVALCRLIHHWLTCPHVHPHLHHLLRSGQTHFRRLSQTYFEYFLFLRQRTPFEYLYCESIRGVDNCRSAHYPVSIGLEVAQSSGSRGWDTMAEEMTKAESGDRLPAPGRDSKKPSPKRKRIIIPVVIIVLLAVVVASYWYLYRRGYTSTNDAFIDGDPVTVGATILGRIAWLGAREGDSVSEGQVLVRLDDAGLRAQEAQAQANLALTEQSLPLARIDQERAQTDFDRVRVQYQDNVVTQEEYDHARQALELAKARYAVAESQVSASEAQLVVVEIQLGNTQVLSPISGVVARKWMMPGDIAQPGQPIFTVYDLANIWVTANLEETKLAVISVGSPVRISVDAYPGREFSGEVLLIGAATASQFSLIPPNNASGNFTKVTQRVPVKISIDRPGTASGAAGAGLLPGMSVVVKVRTGAR
jgi:membrane fusion protein (multidrug efflux system)